MADSAKKVALVTGGTQGLGEAIAKQPARLSGFAALPIAAPDRAAKELERRFNDQAFAGAVINGHQRGRYLDDKFFWPVLEARTIASIRRWRLTAASKPGLAGVPLRMLFASCTYNCATL